MQPEGGSRRKMQGSDGGEYQRTIMEGGLAAKERKIMHSGCIRGRHVKRLESHAIYIKGAYKVGEHEDHGRRCYITLSYPR